ncbi:hypothetical protein AYO22_10699 [Fonsecaea multimorphosa]|nr:hypothetical protein AYO22_10699 [Fonsecaea multimorphosa]
MAWKTSMSTFIGERVHTITLIVMSTAALSPKEYAQPSKSTCRPLLSVQKSMHYHQIQPVDRCAQSKRVCTTIKVNLSTAALSQTEYAQHPELNLSTAALSQTRVCTTSRTQPEVYQNVKVTQCLPSRYSQSTRVCTTSQSQAEVKKCDILQNLPTTALAPIEHIAFKPSSTRSHPNTQGPQDLLATTPTEHPKLKLSSTKIRHGFQVPEISSWTPSRFQDHQIKSKPIKFKVLESCRLLLSLHQSRYELNGANLTTLKLKVLETFCRLLLSFYESL